MRHKIKKFYNVLIFIVIFAFSVGYVAINRNLMINGTSNV